MKNLERGKRDQKNEWDYWKKGDNIERVKQSFGFINSQKSQVCDDNGSFGFVFRKKNTQSNKNANGNHERIYFNPKLRLFSEINK